MGERERIENSKPPGRVVFDGYYNHRVFAQNGHYPGLNMSRAFGDIIAHKEAGLSAEPDIAVLDLTTAGRNDCGMSLLLCTDGVWEFIECKEAAEITAPKQVTKSVEDLAKESWDRWMKDSDHEISDDITVIQINIP